jgi:hypothetical protein
MKYQSALRPTFTTIREFIEEEKDLVSLTDEEKILASGADNKFWLTLSKYFDSSIQVLEQINDNAIADAKSLDEIGKNALVISQVRGVLKKIQNVVSDAKEAQQSGGGEAK